MYCYKCGNGIDDGEVFCRKCGTESVGLVSRGGTGVVRSAGHFLLGSGLFLASFLVILAVLSLFVSGSPQLTMLILVALGALTSGVLMTLLRQKGTHFQAEVHEAHRRNEIAVPPTMHQLPDERFSGAPNSVTDSTTTKLRL